VLAASRFHGEAIARSRRDYVTPKPARRYGGCSTHDGTIIPETFDTMWATDLTATFTGEGQAAVFIAVDHCSFSRRLSGVGFNPVSQKLREVYDRHDRGP